MKRKIFSKLLMGALLVASVSSFVSCKDYDDDINNLQDQINAKAAISQLESLQSTLDSKIAAAQSAAQAAQNTANEAATKVALAETKAALEKAIEDAKKAGTEAGTEAGKAIAAANKAQETADAAAAAAKKADEDAKAALDKALADIKATYATKAEAEAAKATGEAAAKAAEAAAAAAKAAQATADAAFTKAEAAELKKEVEGLKAELEASIDEKIAEKIKEVNNAVASVDAIWSAVTSIEFAIGNNNVWGNTQFLNFQYGKEKSNVFGKATEVNAYAEADKYKTYKEGDDIKAENVYLVRVNPVTADLSTASLKLMNSKGENLDEFVNIAAEKYNDILTRAGETGLWKLTVTLKEGIDIEKLQDATHAIIKGNVTVSAAVYAFGVNDTDEAAAERYAVTAYDLKPLTNEYAPTANLDFNVNGKAVGQIHNRWTGALIQAEDETLARGEEYFELKWQGNDGKGVKVPDTKIVEKGGSDGKTSNVAKDAADARQPLTCLPVNVNEPIIIDFNAADFMFVDSYYVLYDKHNAIESAPSEWNAWRDYKVSGLGIMKKATERLVITIEDEKAAGDFIGFRLYAVNYDGTLVDPDGKAFYVQVGGADALTEVTVGGTFNANEVAATFTAAGYTTAQLITSLKNSVIVDCDFSDLGYDNAITLANANFPNIVTATVAANKAAAAAAVTVDVVYLKDKNLTALGAAQTTTKVNEVKAVLLSVRNPEAVVNGATINTTPVTLVNPDDHDKKLYDLVFSLRKGTVSAPTAWGDNLPAWKSGWAPASGNTVTLYPGIETPALWNTDQSAANLAVDLTQYTNNLLTATAPTLTLYKNGTKLAAAAAAAYYNVNTGVFTIPAGEIGQDAVSGVQFNNFGIQLEAPGLENVSRTWLAGAAGGDHSDAAAQSAAAAPSTSIFSYQLHFANIWDYQSYNTPYTYKDGKVGDPVATFTTKNADKLILNYTAMLPGTNYALTPAWIDAVGGANWTAVAKIDYTQTTTYAAAAYLKTLGGTAADVTTTTGDLLNASSNSALTTFGVGGFAFTNYFSYGAIGSADAPVVITKATGAQNEYVEYQSANPIANNVIAFTKVAGATATLPAATVDMIFQFTATDFLGKKHTIQIPFTLAQ